MTFSEKQLKLLYPAEIHFVNVCTRECLRNAPQWLTEQVVAVYYEATGKKLQFKSGCSACVFNIYRTVGKVYLADLEELAAKPAEQNEAPKNINKKNGKAKRSPQRGS